MTTRKRTMNIDHEHAARLTVLLREGLRILDNWRHMPTMSATLIDWRHEAAEYLRRHDERERLREWENNRGEPRDAQPLMDDARDQLKGYNT